MAEINAMIPLSVKPPANDFGNVLQMAQQAQQFQQNRRAFEAQNMLRGVLSDPNAYDPSTGELNQNAMRAVMAADPKTGMQLQENQLQNQVRQMQVNAYKSEAGTRRYDALSKYAGVGVDAYEDAKRRGLPEPEAQAAGRDARNDAARSSGGVLSNQEIEQVTGTPFEPNKAKVFAMSNKDYAKQKNEVRQEDRLDRGQKETERTHRVHEGLAGGQLSLARQQFDLQKRKTEQEMEGIALTGAGLDAAVDEYEKFGKLPPGAKPKDINAILQRSGERRASGGGATRETGTTDQQLLRSFVAERERLGLPRPTAEEQKNYLSDYKRDSKGTPGNPVIVAYNAWEAENRGATAEQKQEKLAALQRDIKPTAASGSPMAQVIEAAKAENKAAGKPPPSSGDLLKLIQQQKPTSVDQQLLDQYKKDNPGADAEDQKRFMTKQTNAKAMVMTRFMQDNKNATPQELATFEAGLHGAGRLDKPVEVEVETGGEKSRVLAQQDPRTGAWVTADEKRTPVAGVKRLLTTSERNFTENGELSKDSLKTMSEQYLAGDQRVFQNLGRGNQGAKNIVLLRDEVAKQMKASGLTGSDVAVRMAEFNGMAASQRALGTRLAAIEVAASEAKELMPLAITASENVNRTQYPNLNTVLLAAEKGTGSKEVVQLGVATNSLVNVYARAVNPTGVATVSDKDHARELLSTAYSKGQYEAAVKQMELEIDAALKSPGRVREAMRKNYGVDRLTPAEQAERATRLRAAGGAPAAQTSVPEREIFEPTSAEEYDALPAGAQYRRNGKIWVKK